MLIWTGTLRAATVAESSDELTRRFTEALFDEFPDWRRFANPVTENSGNIAIEIKVPQDSTKRFLYLATTDGEITIGFDQWHTHVGPFLGISLEESVATALNMIEDFLREETVVLILERNGVRIESGLHYRAAPSSRVPDATTKVFSWKRTYDETIEAVSKQQPG